MNKIKFKTSTLILLSGFSIASACAQNSDPVLMNVAGKNITKSEFENIYHKNSNKETDKKSLDEYVDLFINFKLKVKEAEEMGLDTSASFKNELEGYRKQLAQPYLVDNEVNEQLLKEAYTRLQTDIRASHILIKLDPNALPKDTLIAYNKAIQIRNRIIKGEDFATVAKQASDDPSAKDNGGDLGYFTTLQMVYPFENMAYATKVSDVSMPVRTRFGYHVIKVYDRRPAQGQLLVSHIMVKAPKGISKEDSTNARNKINEIMEKIKKGEDFGELAKQYSDDKGSAKKGGELPMFGTGRMVAEFEKAAFALKNKGDISEPVLTQYGWHIIKLLDKKGLGTFDEMKSELKGKVGKDSRSQKSKESMISKIKVDGKFKENLKMRDEFVKLIDTTYFEGKWSATKAKALNKTMFTLGDKNYTQADFAAFLESRQTKTKKSEVKPLVDNMYKQFVEQSCINYRESQLASKYPEYRMLFEEYRDGILLFELTDKKVWSAAVKDSAGLAQFYEKNKTNYMWDERVEATIYTCNDASIAEKVKKMINKKKSDEDILKVINKDSQLNLKTESGKYLKGDNEVVDKVEWAPGISKDVVKDKQVSFVNIKKIIPKEPKTLTEAKGLVTADYQSYLEKQWVESLRAKYKVTVNKDVLSTVK